MAGAIDEEYQRIDSTGWANEFQKITETCKEYGYTFVEAKKPENTMYNRYMDICPYDHSRVILKKSNNDYINANVVKIEKANKQYILTQGPTKASTPHFWRMVWEHNCKAIIMLNKRTENEMVKCCLYWPASIGPDFLLQFPGVGLTVEQLTEHQYTNYATRLIRITDEETKSSREVIQFHYTTWPDFGVPSSPTAFLDFLYAVRASGAMDPAAGPPVVHCSAGVGRSGTFCLVDSCLVMIEQLGVDNINIQEVLLEMRRYRMGLIQTPDQLRFSYKAIIKGHQQAQEGYKGQSNGNDEGIYDNPKEDSSDPPPVPPPRAASLKINNDSEVSAENHSNKDESLRNGNESLKNDYNPPMKDLPEVPSDSESEDSEADEVSIPENNSDEENAEADDKKDDSDTPPELPEKPEGLRRRELQSEKTAKLQERIQEMKRKQQDAEKWQRKKRSFYIPMLIAGIMVFGAVSYYSYKNWQSIF